MQIDKETLERIQDKNRKSSRRQDSKQHCQKILQGIGRYDDNTAKRAIWELVQNAKDLSERCKIVIELNSSQLVFKHNGECFDYDSLTSLIKQVSSADKEDEDKTGQFGTGFMTTHKYSRKLTIRGSYQITDDLYVDMGDFKIDRSSNNLPEMMAAMDGQLDAVDKLLEKDATKLKEEWTTFIYELEAEEQKAAVCEGLESALLLMPYVMVINEKIEECTIYMEGRNTRFTRLSQNNVGDGLKVKTILKNEERIDIYYLQSKDLQDIVILPLKSLKEAIRMDGIPKWFISFPLLGTENYGMNYIFHSSRLYPTEPRDMIVVPDGNREHQYKIDQNVKVTEEMCNMLFDYLYNHAANIKNSIHLAPIGIRKPDSKAETMAYYEKRHRTWVDVFVNIPLVESTSGHIRISETDKVKVLDHEIVEFLKQEGNDRYVDVIYEYASKVSLLPAKNELLEWSDIVYEWNSERKDWCVTIEEIVARITEKGENLLDFLNYLRDSKQERYFITKAIIPNREGVLKTKENLRNGKDIKSELYNVCKPLVPWFTDMLVDERYNEITDFTEFGRDDLKTALARFVEEEGKKEHPFEGHFDDMLKFCLVIPTNNTNTDRCNAMRVICRRYHIEYANTIVQHLGDPDKEQLMYRTIFEALIRYIFRHIEQDDKDGLWFQNEDNAVFLYNLLYALSNTEKPTYYQTKVMPDYAIFPNRNGKLCKHNSLKKLIQEVGHPHENVDADDLCRYYYDVLNKDLKEGWVKAEYDSFQNFEEDRLKGHATELDEELQRHQYRPKATIEIITHLDCESSLWKYWFPNIDNNKAKIFLERINGEEERKHIYSVVKTDSNTLKACAELCESENRSQLIKKLHELIEQEKARNARMNHLSIIGKHIEEALKENIEKGLVSVDIKNKETDCQVEDIQNGQDIVVYLTDGEEFKPVFFVEVKSKWNFDEPAHMSTNQIRQAAKHPDEYALCCVDLRPYKDKDLLSLTNEEIIESTKVKMRIGYELQPLVANIIEADGKSEDVQIKISDYRSNMGAKVFVQGDDFDIFITHIKNLINSRLSQ